MEIPKEIMEKFPVVDKYIRDVQFESGFVTIDENKRLREAAIFGYQLALASLSTDAIRVKELEVGLELAIDQFNPDACDEKEVVENPTNYHYGDVAQARAILSVYKSVHKLLKTILMPLPNKPNLNK